MCLEDRTLPSAFTVMNLNDSGPGSLRAGVASGDDTIGFAAGLHGNITLTSGELLITRSVTINGPGANKLAVSGNDASRVIDIAASLGVTMNVTISGLTITHGYAADRGGGIVNRNVDLTKAGGANLTLSGDNLTQNLAYESSTTRPLDELDATTPTGDPLAGPAGAGGAVASLGGTVTITNCQITSNQALGGVGASRFGEAIGGGIEIFAGSATIQGSTVSGNVAHGGDNSTDGRTGGGGIMSWPGINIVDCAISDNLAHGGDNGVNNFGGGGGLLIDLGSTTSTVTGSSFSGNSAVGGNGGIGPFVDNSLGGAIVNDGQPASISDSEFDHNQAIGGSGGNSGTGQPVSAMDQAEGGAIANGFSTLSVTNSSFSHNSAIGGNNGTATAGFVLVGFGYGGAIDNSSGGTADISGCTLDHNQAIGGNGNSGTGATVLVGTGLGGAVDTGFTTTTVSNSTLSHNDALGSDKNIGTASTVALVGAGVGAGIGNFGGTTNVSGSELDNGQAFGGKGNSASGSGAVFAGLGAGGGIGNVLSATTTVDTSSLTNNQANGRGSAAGLGGGAYNDATSLLTLTSASVTGNHTNGKPGIGGGIYNLGTFTVDVFSVIADNHASTSGDNIGP
jgi:hypothetical protein